MFEFIFNLFSRKTEKDSIEADFIEELGRARLLLGRGQLAEATSVSDDILAQHPEHVESLMVAAEIAAFGKDYERAIRLYTKVLKINCLQPFVHYKLANCLKESDQHAAAVDNYNRAVKLDPGHANAFCNRGVVLQRLGRMDEALSSYDQAIRLNPADALAYCNRGALLCQQQRKSEALASFDCSLLAAPEYFEALCNRGLLFQELEKWDAALADYNQAIAIQPGSAQPYFCRGNLFRERRRLHEALASYDRAIEINPHHADAYCNRGVVLAEMRRWDAALASFDSALKISPQFAEAYSNRADVLLRTEQFTAAVAGYDRAIDLKPGFADAHNNRGYALLHLKKFTDAVASYEAAIALKPDMPFAQGMRLHSKMLICDWHDFGAEMAALEAGLEADSAVSPPFQILALFDAARLHQRVAQAWVRARHPSNAALPAIGVSPSVARIRIGYFSADFQDHPVAMLAAEFFEKHDRSRFETIAFSFGPNTQDATRRRMETAFDRFVDVSSKSDEDVALLARSLSVDIAVNLGGHTGGSRTDIFALRAAPIQINFLGYPATMGADYMDYMIADATVVPESLRSYYSEKVLYLPNSFLPHDSGRTIASRINCRSELRLPAVGFVFCCFNSNYKITPGIFASWMRILSRTAGSVLWLSQNSLEASNNLRYEARQLGIDENRLVFADRTPSIEEHLARLGTADLFLDTLPYNAHATALDALWAGLPVLTRMGEGFAGRVAASLLNAIHLPELVTTSTAEYEELAVYLASDPARLAVLREKLARNRKLAPLFDTALFTSHVERAYRLAYERLHAGLPPDHIYVD